MHRQQRDRAASQRKEYRFFPIAQRAAELTLKQGYVQLLAVRLDGTLFVAALDQIGTEEVEAFAPGAHGSEEPVHIINDWPNDPLSNLIIDATGRLYVLPLVEIDEFDHPLTDGLPTNIIRAGRNEFSSVGDRRWHSTRRPTLSMQIYNPKLIRSSTWRLRRNVLRLLTPVR